MEMNEIYCCYKNKIEEIMQDISISQSTYLKEKNNCTSWHIIAFGETCGFHALQIEKRKERLLILLFLF